MFKMFTYINTAYAQLIDYQKTINNYTETRIICNVNLMDSNVKFKQILKIFAVSPLTQRTVQANEGLVVPLQVLISSILDTSKVEHGGVCIECTEIAPKNNHRKFKWYLLLSFIQRIKKQYCILFVLCFATY